MRSGRLDVVNDARTAALVGRRAPSALHSTRSAGTRTPRADRAPPAAAVRTAPPTPPTLVDIDVDTGSSPDFVRLASSVIALLPTLLAGAAASDPSRRVAPPTARAAVYARTPSSLADGRLVLTRVAASGGDDGGATAAAPPDGVLSLDGADAAAEDWLTRQAVVPLPDGGGLVLPLSTGRFLVGLLVVELDAPADENDSASSSSSSLPPPPYTPTPADAAALRGAASVLASAAALDARVALDAADAGARRARAQRRWSSRREAPWPPSAPSPPCWPPAPRRRARWRPTWRPGSRPRGTRWLA